MGKKKKKKVQGSVPSASIVYQYCITSANSNSKYLFLSTRSTLMMFDAVYFHLSYKIVV